MINQNIINARVIAAILAAASLVHGAERSDVPAKHKYVAEVAKLAALPVPAAGGILMVGSSIFRKWDSCAQDLAPLPVTNRGFGGSQTEDQLYFFDKIVPSSRAALVVWYCGSNDINAKKTPDSILQRTKEWIGRTQASLPGVHILLVSVIRAPQKRDLGYSPQVAEVNKGLLALASGQPGLSYLDVNPVLETPAGEPVMECYVADKLHLTPEGYHRMVAVLRPIIDRNWKTPSEQTAPHDP